jgi:hypothetical protein
MGFPTSGATSPRISRSTIPGQREAAGRPGIVAAYARGARHFALARARAFAHLFQFGMLRLVFGFTQVFFVSFAMSCSGWSVKCRHYLV